MNYDNYLGDFAEGFETGIPREAVSQAAANKTKTAADENDQRSKRAGKNAGRGLNQQRAT